MDAVTLIVLFWTCVLLYKLSDILLRIPKITSLTGKHVLITGCDSGFGRRLALKLDSAGMRVITTCLTEQGCSSLRQELSSRAACFRLDMADSQSVQQCIRDVHNCVPEHQGLWGLVNNAGVIGPMAPGMWSTRKDIMDVMTINTIGPFEMIQGLLPLLQKAKGRIVNTSSINGRMVVSQFLPYSISKYGVEAMSDVLRRELKPQGVSVHIIEPGFFRTDILGDVENNFMRAFRKAPPCSTQAYDVKSVKSLADQYRITCGFASGSLHKVVDAYVSALTERHPRKRYVVGWDAKLVFLPISFAPETIQDVFFKGMMKFMEFFAKYLVLIGYK